jgi:hypothetical protein
MLQPLAPRRFWRKLNAGCFLSRSSSAPKRGQSSREKNHEMPPPYPAIHPQLSEAHDPHFNLDSLIDQLCAYINDADTCPHMSPVQKAGVLYLTLIEAYERCGMMQKEHAPDLLLAHDGKDYEVRYHFLLQRYGETHRRYRRYFSPRVSMQSRAKGVHPSSKLRPPPYTLQQLRRLWSRIRVNVTVGRRPRSNRASLSMHWSLAHRRNVQRVRRPPIGSSTAWRGWIASKSPK